MHCWMLDTVLDTVLDYWTSAKSHFRIYPHNLHFNPDYPVNARNSNWRIIIPRMHREDSNPPRGIYHPSLWIKIPHRGSESLAWAHLSTCGLTYPPAGSVCTHKSACGLTNLPVGSQIHMWAHKSMFGLTNLRESGSILMILGTRWSWYFLFRNYHIFFLAHYLSI